jgi:hypothetical protein
MSGFFKAFGDCIDQIRRLIFRTGFSGSSRDAKGTHSVNISLKPGACSFCLVVVGAILGLAVVIVDHQEEPEPSAVCERGHAHTLKTIFPTQLILDDWEDALKKEKTQGELSEKEEYARHLKNQMATIFMVKIPNGHGNPIKIDRHKLELQLMHESGEKLRITEFPIQLNHIKEPGQWLPVQLPQAIPFSDLVNLLKKIEDGYKKDCPIYAISSLEATPGEIPQGTLYTKDEVRKKGQLLLEKLSKDTQNTSANFLEGETIIAKLRNLCKTRT